MAGPDCELRVLTAVGRVSGVLTDDITIEQSSRDVIVPYDSLKLSLKNIEFTIADIGFAANDVPANEEARAALPEACR